MREKNHSQEKNFYICEQGFPHLDFHCSTDDQTDALWYQTGHDTHRQEHEETHWIARLIRHEVHNNDVDYREQNLKMWKIFQLSWWNEFWLILELLSL